MPEVSDQVADEASNSRALMLELELRRGRMRHGLQHALRSAIQEGRLIAGTRLPSSRSLAAELGVSRGVVVDTYDQLAAECYLDVRPRQAPIVAALAPTNPDLSRQPAAAVIPSTPQEAVVYDFIATTPDVELFPRRAWLRAIERAVNGAGNETLDYSDHRGRIELRTELAAYLGRVRGLRTTPERIVVTQGFTQALDLLCRVLGQRGTRRIWFESPSLADVWGTARGVGLEVGAVPVDGAGIRTNLLPVDRAAVDG
jgi:GntR family transcriptional regulator/MocR family aminotransferase